LAAALALEGVPVVLIWHGEEARAKIWEASEYGMAVGLDFLVERIKENIQIPYPPASEPFEFPHARTFDLYNSIGWRKRRRGEYEIGSSSLHALYLELGTRFMDPRPFLVPSIQDNQADAEKIVQTAAKGRIS
jgi:hypothetical protein